MVYHKNINQVPQTKPARPDQTPMASGGFAFEIDRWQQLARFLILGTEGGSYYADEQTLTITNVNAVRECIQEDWRRTLETVLEIYQGNRAPRLAPVLFTLALLSSGKYAPAEAVTHVTGLIPITLRTSPHLFQYVEYVQALRGWGRALRSAVAGWYRSRSPEQLAYQLAKYPGRSFGAVDAAKERWTNGDLIRLSHPKAPEPTNALLRYAVKGDMPEAEHEAFGVLKAMQAIRAGDKSALFLIDKYRLTWEMLPTELLNQPKVWTALLPNMPPHALLRQLATMTRAGLFKYDAPLLLVMEKLADSAWLRKARVHPLSVLVALNTYGAGKGFKGNKTWEPVRQIVDALDKAFYSSIGELPSTGKRVLVAIDISSSMAGPTIPALAGMQTWAAAAAMALATVRAEPLAEVVLFNTQVTTNLPISDKQRLDDVVSSIRHVAHGGTDVSAPVLWALDKQRKFDLTVIYTDNESWAGGSHTYQVWDLYRQFHKPAKLVFCQMTPNQHTLAAPGDTSTLQLIGMDANAPALIEEFAGGL